MFFTKKESKPQHKPDILLMFYRDITRSKHLHFGYWKKGDELTMENLVKAQERYMKHFISFIPKGIKTILDVGAGVGGNASVLDKKGYQVTSLSPDPALKETFEINTDHKIPYLLTKYEDLKTNKTFDLILMSESCQYINVEKGFRQSQKRLNKNGYLLVVDYFKLDGIDDEGLMMAGHSQNHFLNVAREYGFKLVKSDDITDYVAPSFDFMADMYSRYLIPSFKTIARALDIHLPFFYKIARKLLRKKLIYTLEKSNISGATFSKYRRYMVYLFQKK